jgi:hypothetical protein
MYWGFTFHGLYLSNAICNGGIFRDRPDQRECAVIISIMFCD